MAMLPLDQTIAKLPKHRKDWLGVWGNTWGIRRHDSEKPTPEELQAIRDALNPFKKKANA